MRFLFALTLVTSAVIGLSCHATTVEYSENVVATNGDHDNSLNISNGNVATISSAGTSIFIGSLVGTCVGLGIDCNPTSSTADTQDSFAFDVAPGFEIFAVTLFAEGDGPSGFLMVASLNERVGNSFPDVAETNLPYFSFASLNFPPAGPGTYHFVINGRTGDEDGDFSLGWAALVETREIPPVPLPAGLPMLVAGIGALGVLRKRTSPA